MVCVRWIKCCSHAFACSFLYLGSLTSEPYGAGVSQGAVLRRTARGAMMLGILLRIMLRVSAGLKADS